MGATQSTVQEKIPLEAFTVIQQETGFSEKEVSRLFERFQELDVEGKGFLSRRDLLAIPEISLNPVGDRIVHAFFKEGNSNKENDCLEFKNFARVMSHFHTFENDDPRGWERREKKLRFAFSIYDLNDDGVLSRSELLAVLGKMVGDDFGTERLLSLVNRVFKEEDFDEDGLITFEEFLRVLENANMEKICMKFTI